MDLKALDKFVNLPDPHYNYTFINSEKLPYFSIFIYHDTIKMTSQKWLDESEVDKVVWSHTLKIAVPKFESERKSILESCLLMITTDQNDGFISDEYFSYLALTDTAVGTESTLLQFKVQNLRAHVRLYMQVTVVSLQGRGYPEWGSFPASNLQG
uniref:Uncharacterized protein n=1 Tax=Sphaerodactylus townsendi TaxID=933632 RepID=A0ACB8FGA2_9SAUR